MKVLAVLVLCMIAGAAMAADVDADAHPKRAARKLVAAKKSEGRHSWGNQRVVMVPKGDPRAQSPPVPPTPVDPNAEQPIIVEAEEVQRKKHHRRYHNTADVVPAATAASAAAAVVPTARPILKAVAPAAAGACLKSYNGATAAAKASAYQANYKSRGVKYSQPNRQFGIGAKYADCSSFVTSILADVGMNCLFANGRYTAYMNEQIRARGGYKQTAKAGDIVMWGSHTGMIVKVCSSTTYSMVAMGNSGAGLAVCKTVDQLKSWGSGGWLGFWTPRP